MSLNKIPKLVRFLSVVFIVTLVTFTLWRLAFWQYFTNAVDPIPSNELQHAFYLGLKYDVRLALFMILPVYLIGWYRPISPFNKGLPRRLWLGYLALVMLLALVFYTVNFGYFAYLHVPLDATALRFLLNIKTSMLMVWQTYPVIWIALGLALLVALYLWALNRLAAHYLRLVTPQVSRRRNGLTVFIVTSIMILGMYGKLSWYPLRWSDAFTTPHPLASAVSINPILYMMNTLKNREVNYDLEATKAVYADIVTYLNIEQPDPVNLNYQRVSGPNALHVNRPNVVMVMLESFASYKSGLGGNPLNPTPNVDTIAKNGLYFDNFFTPHTGTARSVFAALTGLPDIEMVKTSTRNPLAVNQNIIINAFEGYAKYYFLGGSASWGNIRGLLQRNIPGLNVYEEGSYESPRIDVWGISDLDLFKEANAVLKTQTDRPFFAVIQTSGNHRPYTIPDDTQGFQLSTLDEKKIKQYGFNSAEEFNSYRFMDYSVGYFMQLARREKYFDNTIFVFFGDHGIYADTGKHTPKSEMQLGLHSYRVPLIFYAPKLLPQGQVYSLVASEVDVLPSLAGLGAERYINTTIGRDLFDERFDEQRYAFIAIHANNSVRISLVGSEFYFSMQADGEGKTLQKIQSADARNNVAAQHMDITQKMAQITRAIYESTRYMRYNNGSPKNGSPNNGTPKKGMPKNGMPKNAAAN